MCIIFIYTYILYIYIYIYIYVAPATTDFKAEKASLLSSRSDTSSDLWGRLCGNCCRNEPI